MRGKEKQRNCHSRQQIIAAIESLEIRQLLIGSVVINEIHYEQDNKTEPVEFIELYNPGDAAVDLSGASFTNGITYTFPNGTSLAAGGYKVIASDPAAVQSKFGATGVLGPWSGKLSNDGETITIKSASNVTLDTVTYQPGFPWPLVGEAPGRSIELINPTLDNNVGGNWRSGILPLNQLLINNGSSWKYRKGTNEASSPTSAWRANGFAEDITWLNGTGPIGYDSSLAMGTALSDMNGSYSSVFMRKTFTISNPATYTGLRLEAFFDDGFNVWINGVLAKSQNMATSNPSYNTLASVSRESGSFDSYALSNLLVAGTNTIAVQFHNISLSGSSDAFFDVRLYGTNGGTGGPTPGAVNANFAANAAPSMSQLTVSPAQPAAGQDVTITMKVTDPDNISTVNLEYQSVNPGSYIRLTDAAYATSWTTLAMHDDGINGDAVAADGVYSVVIPSSVQTNRKLVRYRVTATDGLSASIRAPYADDTSSNFAYFVYNGVPSWTGADQPGVTPTTNFPTSITANGPAVYHIIANAADISNSQYVSTYDGVDFTGTLVYDGIVYDNIRFSNRGEYSTYVSGKNKWKLDFNNGHYFQAKDNYGNPYSQKWGKLNLNANASPWMPVNRGMAGLDEAVAFRLYQLAGVLSSNTNYVHLRVIDNATESPSNQYDGDLWGLYLAVENQGSQFVDEHGINDGNTFSISGGAAELKNQGDGQPADGSDWNTFKASASTTSTPLSWWQSNFDLDSFYSFTAINRVISNVDLRVGDNYNMYHDTTGVWQVMPWDLDMLYAPETHQSGVTYMSNSLVYNETQIGLRNRAREVLDLLFSNASSTGGQVGQLFNEYARFLNTPNGSGGWNTGWAELDRYMWNYSPRTTLAHKGQFYVTPKPDTRFGGTWNRTLASADFAGSMKYALDFMTDTDPDSWAIGDGDQRGYGYNYLEYEAADADIPNKPTTTYIGGSNFPVNNLKFSASAFSDPNSSAFAAMEWRVGEISNPGTSSYDPNQSWLYEINPVWESGEITTFNSQITVPSASLQAGHTYRLRVRYKDATGRWSHWSNATVGGQNEFTTTAATGPLPESIRVTELNYNPAGYPGVTDSQDLEFIELTNYGTATVDLAGSFFSSGITFTFPSGATLAPGQSGVVVRGQANFQVRYGTSPLILGTYGASGTNLSNGGEAVAITDTSNNVFGNFTYVDSWYPSTDGGGFTLEVIDPASNPNLNLSTSWRASLVAGGTPGVNDRVAPSVTNTAVDLSTAQATLKYTFNENVNPTIGLADVVVTNLTTQTTYNPLSVSYDTGTNVATFNFPAGALPDGNYSITLSAAGVTDASGNPLSVNYVYEFFSLIADANNDRHVDAADQAILTANLGQSGNFWQGDFNRDGAVSSADQTILTSALNLWLPAQGALALPTTGNDDAVKLQRDPATAIINAYYANSVSPTYRIYSGAVTVFSFNGGIGNDSLTLDYASGNPFSGTSFTYNGGGDNDSLKIVGNSSANTATFNPNSVVFGTTTINTSNIESHTFDGKLGWDDLTVNGGASVKLTANQEFNSLTTIGGQIDVVAGSNAVISTKSLNLNATAGSKLDLHDNDLLIDYTGDSTVYPSIISWLQSGLTLLGGNGTGLASTEVDAQMLPGTMLAVVDNAEVGGQVTELGGVPVPMSAVIVKYTWFGDNNVDGAVDGSDYALIDTGFSSGGTISGWVFGDYDYSNLVDGSDYALIDTGLISQDRIL